MKYQHDADWDFCLEDRDAPIDLTLILPHYRARYQPVDHRMAMFVSGNTESIKLKVVWTIHTHLLHLLSNPFILQCRPFPRSKFCLSVHAKTSNVTIWLPSDFHGKIRFDPSNKVAFSAGFVNKILQNVRLNEPFPVDTYTEDDVVIVTRGRITFRMWDVQSGSPENAHKEALKRIFCGSSRKNPENGIDWDCLLKD